jgi:hypothetical protein
MGVQDPVVFMLYLLGHLRGRTSSFCEKSTGVEGQFCNVLAVAEVFVRQLDRFRHSVSAAVARNNTDLWTVFAYFIVFSIFTPKHCIGHHLEDRNPYASSNQLNREHFFDTATSRFDTPLNHTFE